MQIAQYTVAIATRPARTVTTCASSAQAAARSVALAYPTLPPRLFGAPQLVRVLYQS
jgi:hypothetical protein